MPDFTVFTVSPDDQWPIGPNGPVLEACGNWGKFAGWWNRSQFDDWLKQRGGRIITENGNTIKAMAPLTKKEKKAGFR